MIEWRPTAVSTALRARARMLACIRTFFAEAGVLRDVIKPYLPPPSSDPAPPPAMQVVVEYGNAHARCAVELGRTWRVRPQDDLLAQVRERLHPQSVAIEY